MRRASSPSRRWRRLGTLAVAATFVTTAACDAMFGVRALSTARPGATTYHALASGGTTRRFLLHLPPQAARGRVPLVLAFHGHDGNGATLRESSGLDAVADALGFAVAYPDGTGRFRWVGLAWNAVTCCGRAHARSVDDVAFADAVIAAVAHAAPVDTTRVFAVGFSAGGMLALRLACERADTYAAVADVAGTMPDAACAPARPVSVLLIQGAEDDELRDDLRELRQPHGNPFAHSLEAAFAFWARHDGCAGAPVRDSSRARVTTRASGCASRRAVELYTIAEHPHAWPGGRRSWFFAPRPSDGVDASRVVLAFFATARR